MSRRRSLITPPNYFEIPLLERTREVAAFDEAMSRARAGVGSILMVEGSAGIGKTRLLGEAGVAGERAGLVVRRARGSEMERALPFGVARQLFEPVIARASQEQLAALLEGAAHHSLVALGRSQDAPPDRFGPIHGLYWLLVNLTETNPVELTIDDVQWSDDESLRFISFLARRIVDVPVVLVLGSRTSEPNQPGDLRDIRKHALVLEPRPLSSASVRELASACFGGEEPSETFVTTCATTTGGNPFLTLEVLRQLVADGAAPDDATAVSLADRVPRSVTTEVLSRLSRFGADAVALGRAIAVLVRAQQLRQVAQLANLTEERAREISDPLRDAQLLADGFPMEFAHPLLREAIYRDLGTGERSEAHRRAAGILAETGGSISEVAAHLLQCAVNGDQWVVGRLGDAADAAVREGAYERAVTYLERALQEPPNDSVPIAYSLGRILIYSEPLRAPSFLKEVVDNAVDPSVRLDALRLLALAHIWTANFAEAERACDAVLEALPPDEEELVLATEGQRYMLRTLGRGTDSSSSERIQRWARTAGHSTAGARMARQAAGVAAFLNCHAVDEVADLAIPFPPLPWEIRGIATTVPVSAGKVLAWSGRWDIARDAFSDLIEFGHTSGRIATISLGNSLISEVDRLAGRLIDSEAAARTAWHIAQSLSGFSAATWSALMNLAATLISRGDVAGFVELTEGLDLSVGPPAVPLNPWPLELRACLRLERGDLQAAVEDLLQLGDSLERMGYLNPAYPPWRQEAAEALARSGGERDARDLLDVAEERASAFGAPHAVASVLRARALLQPVKQAIETLERSVDLLAVSGPPHELARCLVELGAALRRDGQRVAARQPLRRALELSATCGAGGIERRARSELAAVGSRPRRAASSGIRSLTPTELRVAKLAAAGFDNKEIAQRLFVTRRTVETHLTNVYKKLKIKDRRELPRFFSQDDA